MGDDHIAAHADNRIEQGSPEWFEMIGRILIDAANTSGMPAGRNTTFVERYVDGMIMPNGLIQGLRIDIEDGHARYRIGAAPDERGDVTVEVTARAARELNLLASADPAFAARAERARANGEWRVDGDLASLGPWIETTHDAIVARTR